MISRTSLQHQVGRPSTQITACIGGIVWLLTGIVALPGLAAPPLLKTDSGISPTMTRLQHTAPVLVAQNQDVVDTAIAHGSLNMMMGLFEELGMAEDLRGYGRFTLFAPTDNAFRAVPANVFQALASDRELMARVLAYHIVASSSPLGSNDISGTASYRTLERSDVEVRSRGRRIYVNDARVIEKDIAATNGVIHIIDRVLIPEDVLAQIQ